MTDSQVQGVWLWRSHRCYPVSVSVTPYHLVLIVGGHHEEIDIPLIAHASRRPLVQVPRIQKTLYPISIYLSTNEHVILGFTEESAAVCTLGELKQASSVDSVQEFYAFHSGAKAGPGWNKYNVSAEFKRQGVGSRSKAWRFSTLNAQYEISPSYPATLVVPSNISDNTLLSAAKHRSKGRVPTLTYLHWANNASLSRSSQPMVGMTQNRSSQDEKLVEAIFASHRYTTEPASETAVYGATTTNLIVDARPTTNAMANHAKGAGSENMEHYKDCKKVYLGIDNIHVMRVSLNKVHAALRAADEKTMFDERTEPEPVDASLLMRSQWLKHSSAILQGVQQIVRNIHIHSSHVLVHCSDGWDRTAQLSSLAALCLDPYYRTFVGFVVLIEKDWLSFGHQFQERHGLVGLASNRFDLRAPQHDLVFDADVSEDERVNDSQGTSQSFWDFTKSITAHFQGGAAAQCAPIFFQFLDCVWQIQRQFPARFEFTSEWLTILMKCIYDGRSASFLFNSERERRTPSLTSTLPPCEVAPSVWDLDLQREQYRQPLYDPSLDAREGRGDQGVILPEPKDVRFSPDLFRRRDSELNVLVDVEKESQTRLKERLATASRGGHTKHVAPPSTVQADPLIPEEALHNAARSVRALFSDGWGRVQEAMRATGLDASPFAPTENQATDFVPPQSVDNPWASHTLDEPVAGLHTLSLESTHSEQTAYNNDTASVIPTSSADPLGAWKI